MVKSITLRERTIKGVEKNVIHLFKIVITEYFIQD